MKASAKHDSVHKQIEKPDVHKFVRASGAFGLSHCQSASLKAGKFSNSVAWHVERRRPFRTKTGNMWSADNLKLYVVFSGSLSWPRWIYDKQSKEWYSSNEVRTSTVDTPFITNPPMSVYDMHQMLRCGSYAEYVAWRICHDSSDDDFDSLYQP